MLSVSGRSMPGDLGDHGRVALGVDTVDHPIVTDANAVEVLPGDQLAAPTRTGVLGQGFDSSSQSVWIRTNTSWLQEQSQPCGAPLPARWRK